MSIIRPFNPQDYLGECILCGEDLYNGAYDEEGPVVVDATYRINCIGEDSEHIVPYDEVVNPPSSQEPS